MSSQKRMALLGTAVEKLVALPEDRFGTVDDFLTRIADNEGWDSAKKYLRGETPWPETHKTASKLLVLVKEVGQPAIAAFSPKDKFRVTPEKDRESADVIIGKVDSDLQVILNSRGIEPARDVETLRINRLAVVSRFVPILGELGNKTAITFGRVWQMIEKQGHGEAGDLLVNGYLNFFPIEGTDQVLRCDWCPVIRCWSFGVYPVSASLEWGGADLQFVSLADS